MRRLIALLLLVVLLSGCQQMSTTQIGVRFRRLPPSLGPLKIGGIATSIVAPGQLAILMPWDTVYAFNTAVQDISWPEPGRRGGGMVNTRAKDGNEVALGVTVSYRVLTGADKLVNLVQRVATSDQGVRELVKSMARSDIRTFTNELRTSDFLDEESRYAAIDKVRQSLQRRLEPFGIEVSRVILNDFRFERLLQDGTVDDSYQEKITETQKLREETEREKSRIETVKAKKQQEFNQVQARVNRQVAEADGYKKQAVLRGNAYLESKTNEGKGILALGKAEYEGLIKQIEALSGVGARAVLRLEIAKQLLKGDPRFVVLNQGKGAQDVVVQRLETNELLSQLGLIEGLKPRTQGAQALPENNPKPEQAAE